MSVFSNKISIAFLCFLATTVQTNPLLNEKSCDDISSERTQDCCNLGNIYTKSIKEQCKEFIKDSNPEENSFMLGLAEENYCYTNCALNEMDFFKSGSLNEEKMWEYLKEVLNDKPEMISITAGSFIKCVVNTEIIRNNITAVEGFCSREAAILLDCVYMGSYMSCMGSAWTNTNECNEQRDYIGRCLGESLLWK